MNPSPSDYNDEECPITLEPLKDLPYPPFELSSSHRTKHYFDGAALATYIVSQGTFTNPLTRSPLKYEDCVLLDEYLDEYVFNGHNYSHSERISVREAWSLRESIKVKVTRGEGYDENQRRREEVLRNEASVALRGLFVFGHERKRNNINTTSNEVTDSQTLPRTAGGFNLYHHPDSSLTHSWGLGSTSNQEGLLIIDDDEAAHEAADVDVWREVQEDFPILNSNGENRTAATSLPTGPCDQHDMPTEVLATVRHTADLTMKEEKEKEEMMESARQRYFLEALERKRKRIEAKIKAKGDTANALLSKKKYEAEQNSAKEEIDRWLNQKWNEWETETDASKRKAKESTISTADEACEFETAHESSPTPHNSELSEEEKAAKAAARKKAKRKKAKQRAKEKIQKEKVEQEKTELAMALQKEKERSATKCDACGDGILGFGFDKFGKKYCSTKCARSGSK